MDKNNKPILCLAFDGVIHSYTSGWKGANVIPDEPVPGAERFSHEALEHFKVAIFSSRSHQDNGIPAMIMWMRDNFRLVNPFQLDWPVNKPPAMITIDDRALTFTGEWPSIQYLKEFKPWNKK